jgi:hypothetical protein
MKEKRFFELLGFSVMVLTTAGLTAYASPTPLNGDFSAGLTDWNLEYGTVTDGGGFALFQEHATSLSSTLSQEFTIPALALELSFDLVMSAAGTPDPSAWADAFTASLLDPVTLDPLIYNPGYTEFYYLDNTGLEQTVATVSGNTIALDISGLRGLNAFLSFDLWASYDGMDTSVNLDNVNISLIPAPGALLLALMGTGAVGLWRRLRPR